MQIFILFLSRDLFLSKILILLWENMTFTEHLSHTFTFFFTLNFSWVKERVKNKHEITDKGQTGVRGHSTWTLNILITPEWSCMTRKCCSQEVETDISLIFLMNLHYHLQVPKEDLKERLKAAVGMLCLSVTSVSLPLQFAEQFKEVKEAARLAREKSQERFELANPALNIAAPEVKRCSTFFKISCDCPHKFS